MYSVRYGPLTQKNNIEISAFRLCDGSSMIQSRTIKDNGSPCFNQTSHYQL